MTNQEKLELIAQAREKLLREIKFENDKIVYNSQNKQPFILAMATTHLAEMDEIEAKIAEIGNAFTDNHMKKALANTYREQLLTKAKRLLGVE